jgi:KUP system potassium uptake protein
VPLLFGLMMAIMIWTWRRRCSDPDREDPAHRSAAQDLIKSLEKRPPTSSRAPRCFLTSDPNFVPTALLHNLKHNKVLHEHNVILTIETAQTPRVDLAERVRMENISEQICHVRLRFGSWNRQTSEGMVIARKLGWQFDIMVDVVLRVAAIAETVIAVGNAACGRITCLSR